MTTNEILSKLKETFAELTGNTQPQVAPVALMTATLKDGTSVEVTELAVGGIVTINGTPAPIGEHELEDGTIIVVGDNGAIMEIKTPVVVEEPVMEDMNSKFAAFESATNEKFAAYETKFSEYEAKLAKAYQVIEGLMNLTQTLADTPTAVADNSVSPNKFAAEPKKDKDYSILFS